MDASNISTGVGVLVAAVFIVLWMREQAKYDKLLEAHQQTPEEKAAKALSAPQQDPWHVRQFHLMELAWLGYEEAHECMDGEIAPYSRKQLGVVRAGDADAWDGYKRLNGYLRDIEIEGWEDSADDTADNWLEECEKVMHEEIPKQLLRSVLQLDDEDRMALFDVVCDRSPRLVRLSKGDSTALSLGPVELVAYLRDIGVDEKRVAEALRCHSDHLKTMASVDQELALFQASERLRQAVHQVVGTELEHLKAAADALPSTERAKARERVEALECRILELRNKHEAERVRVKLDEVEIAVETDAEMDEMMRPTIELKR